MNDGPGGLAARIREPAAAAVRQTSMALHRAAAGGCILACLLAASACGSGSAPPAPAQAARAASPAAAAARSACASGSAFALSLVSDRGGQPTPVAAAAWFARHGGVTGVPGRGLAGGRPPWPRRDRPVRPGHPPRRPGTRPDMAGRQRQLVLLTQAVRRHDGPDGSAFHPRTALGRRQLRTFSYAGRYTDRQAGGRAVRLGMMLACTLTSHCCAGSTTSAAGRSRWPNCGRSYPRSAMPT